MIYDFLANWENYSNGRKQIWRDAFDFISSVGPDTEEKKYILNGEDIYAFVQGYGARGVDESKVESHCRYIDIHSVISGKELMYYCPATLLELVEDLTPENDDLLYTFQPAISTGFQLSPGRFSVFFPGEGHMGCIHPDGELLNVKKVVVKVAKYLVV